MRIEFQKITIRDFKEYRGRHRLRIGELGLGLQYVRGRNRVDAIGSNGAGKSTIWDAFRWALTGRTTRGLRGTDVRTWGGREQAHVWVFFRIDKQDHVIHRSTQKNGLWLDGKMTSQEAIDRLLVLNDTNIGHTILLGQKQELFFDLKPAEKMEILSRTIGLDRWEARSVLAKKTADEIDREIIGIDASTRQIERNLDSCLDQLRELKRASADWEDKRNTGAEERRKKIETLKKSRAKWEKDMGDHDLAYDGSETELRAVRRDLVKMREQMDEVLEKLGKRRSKRDTLKARWEELKALAHSDTCPTCGQTIRDSARHAAEARAKTSGAKKAYQIAADRVVISETQKEMLRDKIVIQAQAEKDFAAKSDDAKDKYDQHKAKIAEIDQEIAVLKASDREDEENPLEKTIRDMRALIREARAKIAEHQDLIDAKTRKRDRTRWWVKGFRDVRLYLLQEALDELQDATQSRLDDVGLNGWTVQYEIERETKAGTISTGLNVSILKPGMNRAVRWEAWSGGENQRLLIMGALALSDVLLARAGVECDMIVLDEPTRHMSKEGINDLVEHLLVMGRERQVFYCDHAAIESSRFANVITVTKDEEGSRIDVN